MACVNEESLESITTVRPVPISFLLRVGGGVGLGGLVIIQFGTTDRTSSSGDMLADEQTHTHSLIIPYSVYWLGMPE